jgi:hypothetical protein
MRRNGATFALTASPDAETGLVGWGASADRTGLFHQFRANREVYREFFAGLGQFNKSGADLLGNFNHLRRISLLNETGNYLDRLGNSSTRNGNFARLRNMTWSFASHDSVLCSRSLAYS